ncbi:MAG: ParB/RepB/Spo0J family partition protein [Candidatus Marinimicrobia bacterium]|nr:ParB/RepB/Spo0J family partition protein [Candidatus Neomarinimicrobiota bacterium]
MVRRLGKGLNAIIASHRDDSSRGSGVATIAIKQITANPQQPRQYFDNEALQELAASIKQKGVITPITVRDTDGRFMLIAGERRWRAAKLAGLEEIPAYIIEITDDVDMVEVALIENIQRENLNPIEEAEAYAVLSGKHDLSQEDIAKAVGKKRVTITNSLRLLKLPLKIKHSLRDQVITAGHGRALLGLKTTRSRLELWQRIVRDGQSVRMTEALVKKMTDRNADPQRKSVTHRLSPQAKVIEDELISILGTKIKLKTGKKGGNITISYYSDEDLDRLLELMRSIEA